MLDKYNFAHILVSRICDIGNRPATVSIGRSGNEQLQIFHCAVQHGVHNCHRKLIPVLAL